MEEVWPRELTSSLYFQGGENVFSFVFLLFAVLCYACAVCRHAKTSGKSQL